MYYSKLKKGFYVTEIHGDNIPADAVEITDEQHTALLQAQSGGLRIDADSDGNPIAVAPPPPTLADIKQAKLLEINAAFEQAMQQIVGSYPSNEVSSWAKQETEARAYVADNVAPTPLIDALAANRGVAKAELITRIIAKADLFAEISGTLIGRRQGLEDALDALPATAEDIAAISWM